MRIHVNHPKPTTVSVDDALVSLLGAALVLDEPELFADAKRQASRARTFVRKIAEKYGGTSLDGMSKLVQREIVRCIANPRALAVLEARDTEEAKAKAEAYYLQKCAENNWLTPVQIAEKKRLKALAAEGRRRRKQQALTRAGLKVGDQSGR